MIMLGLIIHKQEENFHLFPILLYLLISFKLMLKCLNSGAKRYSNNIKRSKSSRPAWKRW